jgi:CubicO group peptidase (beta-lactamase class C family)
LVSFQTDSTFAQNSKNSRSQKGIVKGETAAKLGGLLTRYAMYGFSGTVLAAKNGKVILNRGYGLADRERRVRNSAETVFAIGSLIETIHRRRNLQANILKIFRQTKRASPFIIY